MRRVGYPVAVAQQATRIELVVVGTRLSVGRWHGRDAERQVENRRLEDPLRREQRNTTALELESRQQLRVGEGLPMGLPQTIEEVEGDQSDTRIVGHLGAMIRSAADRIRRV